MALDNFGDRLLTELPDGDGVVVTGISRRSWPFKRLETYVKHLDYRRIIEAVHETPTVMVETYKTEREALVGHWKWVDRMSGSEGERPDFLMEAWRLMWPIWPEILTVLLDIWDMCDRSLGAMSWRMVPSTKYLREINRRRYSEKG